MEVRCRFCFFFFQAEDGIRDDLVTGVQTCALPICGRIVERSRPIPEPQLRKPFTQVNVFSTDPLGGNPLAVVHAAEGLTESQMAALARWPNLSETTFLLPPPYPRPAYSSPIFTPPPHA